MMTNNFAVLLVFLIVPVACHDFGDEVEQPITSDAQLFALITQTRPFGTYPLFPNADSVTTGTLNGSNAHQPEVRVSVNAVAFKAMQNGRLPAGTTFPDGSVIFKQIRSGRQAILYAVLLKDRDNPLAANGWLWGEYRPNGTVAVSIEAKGTGCVGCHLRERGSQNDLVRTFERQY